MRKWHLVATIVLLSSLWVIAQSAGGTVPVAAQGGQPSTAGAHDTLLEGCLGGASDSFTLTDVAGKVYLLRGDTAQLTDHVGQQISIVGTEEPGSASGVAKPTFTLKKVKLIGSVCSASK